ncbi:Serine/threonine-protein phosphatase 2A activator 1 [Teratosphaeria destructans]|uniref:Serine/threonine-protein phosphatase 2A activator n=1 Tax=Teratosphaeria destructans TaxID=418781 RepID=A0A9W7W3Q4_9PEZI|nr:Serine/threonine-protein phosphatase 2A activator 1 [Teratosphaeria destructans]
MDTGRPPKRKLALSRLDASTDHIFETPAKRINDGDDLDYFLASTAYRDLTLWLLQLNRAMFPIQNSTGKVELCTLDSKLSYSNTVVELRGLLNGLSALLEKAPPSTGPRRFGNVAFREWYRLAEEAAPDLLRKHLSAVVSRCPSHEDSLISELSSYLLGSFGSAQRLDYGTGHELSFLAFLGCLWKLDSFKDGEERSIVTGVIQPYLDLIRNIIMKYTLEPAGSHGVWGLDDHSFAPYIFGSAQYGPSIDPTDETTPTPTEGSLPRSPAPASVAKKDLVEMYKDSNMYFSAIHFIHTVKKGPFWEHSPILYDISGIKDGWAKINKGMLKMYVAEVLGKFPVVQHFPFGSLFRWEQDPEAPAKSTSVHSQHQPQARSKEETEGSAGTAAPWAKPALSGGATAAQMPAATGVPSMRAPWAGGGTDGRPQVSTAAPWTATQRPSSGTTTGIDRGAMPPTAAPWARKDGADGAR